MRAETGTSTGSSRLDICSRMLLAYHLLAYHLLSVFFAVVDAVIRPYNMRGVLHMPDFNVQKSLFKIMGYQPDKGVSILPFYFN